MSDMIEVEMVYEDICFLRRHDIPFEVCIGSDREPVPQEPKTNHVTYLVLVPKMLVDLTKVYNEGQFNDMSFIEYLKKFMEQKPDGG
jgi:hypothetical protein